MQKIHFVTFVDKLFKNATDRIIEEAKNSNIFNIIHNISENDLDNEFINNNSEFSFKSQVIYEILYKIKNIIIYYNKNRLTIKSSYTLY